VERKILEERIKGQIALPFVLLVSGIIIEIVLAGTLISHFSTGSGYAARTSLRSSVAAHAGLNDALSRISRDKEFGLTNPSYEITIGSDKANVSFNSQDLGTYYVYQVTSLGSALTGRTKLSAKVIVDKETGVVRLESLNQLPVE